MIPQPLVLPHLRLVRFPAMDRPFALEIEDKSGLGKMNTACLSSQHPCVLQEVLEKGHLAFLPSEFTDSHNLDAQHNAHDRANLIPQLKFELPSGFITSFTPDMQTRHIRKALQESGQHLGIIMDSKTHIQAERSHACEHSACAWHDDGAAGLKGVLSWLQVPERFQVGGIANVDPGAQATGSV